MARKVRADGKHGAPGRPGGTGALEGQAPRAVRRDGRLKRTVLLPPDLDRELGVIAAYQGRERSEVAADAMRMYLAKFGLVQALRRADPPAPAAAGAPAPDPAEAPSPGAGEGRD